MCLYAYKNPYGKTCSGTLMMIRLRFRPPRRLPSGGCWGGFFFGPSKFTCRMNDGSASLSPSPAPAFGRALGRAKVLAVHFQMLAGTPGQQHCRRGVDLEFEVLWPGLPSLELQSVVHHRGFDSSSAATAPRPDVCRSVSSASRTLACVGKSLGT